jgi:hypothetical protein
MRTITAPTKHLLGVTDRFRRPRVLLLSVWMLMSSALAAHAATKSDSLQVADESGDHGNEIKGLYLNDPLIIEDEVDAEMQEHLFPLMKSVAKGQALPKPWAIGFFQYGSLTDYTIQEATIGVGNFPDQPVNVEGTVAEIQVITPGIKGSLWLFPFLNVHATMSYVWLETDIYMEDVPTGVNPPDPPSQPLPELIYGNMRLLLELKGPTFGTGATFAFGYRHWWSTVTFSYAYSSLEAVNWEAFGTQKFTTYMLLPKVGYGFEGTSIWLGARYMDDETRHTGSLEDGDFRFDVLITEAKWSPEVGLNTIMSDHWELTVVAGYLPRIFAYFSVSYRI